MKYCPACQQWKDDAEFARNRAKPDGLQSHCRACKKHYDHGYYKAHTSEQLERVRTRQREIAEDNARRVYEYLLTHPCVDCGEADPVILEFDHVRGTKVASVSFMIERKFAWDNILAEIEKCDVCCANCHRRRTAARRGSRRFNWKGRT